MADSTSTNPLTNLAQSGNPKSASQAMTPASKQGKTENTYFSVKGNVHEVPAGGTTQQLPQPPAGIPEGAVRAAPAPTDLMKPYTVTEEQRALTQRQFEETQVSPELSAAIAGIQADALKAGSNKQLTAALVKQVIDDFNKKTGVVLVLYPKQLRRTRL